MTIYAYLCRTCGATCDSSTRAATLGACLDPSCRGELRRKYSISIRPSMQPHFNHTVGKPISSMSEFRDELKRSSERETLRTGIECNYVPIEAADAGATMDGMDATNTRRMSQGLPPVEL